MLLFEDTASQVLQSCGHIITATTGYLPVIKTRSCNLLSVIFLSLNANPYHLFMNSHSY